MKQFIHIAVMSCILQIVISGHTMASGKPLLSAPVNGSTGYARNPGFTWADDADAYSYEIQIATDTFFSNIVASRTGLYIPRYVPLIELPVTKLYWHVRSLDTLNNAGSWSDVSVYTIIQYPNIYSIPDNASFATVKQVLDMAAAHTPAMVKFAYKGTYHLDPGGGQFMFNCNNINDLMIDGNHASITIMDHLETGFMQFTNCSRIVVKRVSIDWNPLPQSMADVIKVNNSDPNTLNINVRLRKVAGQTSPYYPALVNNPAFTDHWSWTCLMDPANHGALKKGVNNAFGINAADVTPFACTDPPEYNIIKRGSASGSSFATGDVLAILCRENVGSLLSNHSCVDITYDSIVNYSSPMGCFYLLEGSDLKVLNCRSALKDSTRFLSANADGVHCRANLVGPWVENCSFIGNGDDAVALYNKGVFVKNKNAATNLTVLNTFMNFKSGDVFDIYTPKTGVVISDSFHLASAPVNNGNGSFTINFQPAIQGADYTAMSDVGNADLQQNVQLFNKTRYNNNFMISNNLFTVRGRGAIIRSMNGVVENNKIYDCSATAVGMYNEPAFWTNGLNSTNVKVIGNDIRDCAFDNLDLEGGAINIKFYRIRLDGTAYEDTLSSTMPHANILIKGNSIRNFAKHGIVLSNAKYSSLLDNSFTNTVTGFIYPGNHYGIYLNTTDGCRVKGNILSGETRPLDDLIKVEHSVNTVVIP